MELGFLPMFLVHNVGFLPLFLFANKAFLPLFLAHGPGFFSRMDQAFLPHEAGLSPT